LLDVLAAAHEKGVHHGALCMDDVFVTRQGHVKVLGFEGATDRSFDRDIAAVGRILYTMLAGMPPNGAPLWQKDVPPAVARVIDRALCVEHDDPWHDAGEMQAALRAAWMSDSPRVASAHASPSADPLYNPLFMGIALAAAGAVRGESVQQPGARMPR